MRRSLALAAALVLLFSPDREGGVDGNGQCRRGDEACFPAPERARRFKWLNKDHLCGAEAERAPRVIEAHKDVSLAFRDLITLDGLEGGMDRRIGLLQDIVRLTHELQLCTVEIYKDKGVSHVDLSQLMDPALWCNSILAHTLDAEDSAPFHNALDAAGWAAMHLAVRLRLLWAVEGLAKRGADINVTASAERCSWTPMHVCAAAGGEGGCALRLHELGADLGARDCRGEMPEEVAAREGHADVAWSLRTWRACSDPARLEECLAPPAA